MPVEEILEKIELQRKVITVALNETDRLVKELGKSHFEEYDWISVKEASRLLDVSINVVYNKINAKELDVKYIGSKKFVRRSQIVAINDRGEN